MAVYKVGTLAAFASLALAACGGGGSPLQGGTSSPTAPPVVTRSYTFPSGDATAASGDTAWDITGVTTTLSGQFGGGTGNSYDTLRVDVTFAQKISNALPAAGAALATGNQLGVGIDLDTDANTATGSMTACATTSLMTPFEDASDVGNDPSRLADGNYSILAFSAPISSGGHNAPSEANVSVSGNTFSETFFLTAIGVNSGKTIPKIGVAVGAVNYNEITDCVPALPSLEVFTS